MLTAVLAGIVGAAVVVAWSSADRVVEQNRAWTRAWRIFVALVFNVPIFVNGIMLPLGAVYILARYWKATRTDAHKSAGRNA